MWHVLLVQPLHPKAVVNRQGLWLTLPALSLFLQMKNGPDIYFGCVHYQRATENLHHLTSLCLQGWRRNTQSLLSLCVLVCTIFSSLFPILIMFVLLPQCFFEIYCCPCIPCVILLICGCHSTHSLFYV